jgi:hypothetical protein
MTDTKALVDALGDLATAVEAVEEWRDASADLEPVNQADAIALVKDLRQRLGAVEQDLAATLGKAEGPIQGNLSDGRQFTLKRTQDRKEWDHDGWKRDARRAVTAKVLADHGLPSVAELVDDQGEVTEVALGRVIQEAMTELQNVHGSAEPKSTALKPLGLFKGDYCTSSPGGWILNAVRPTETATEKDTTDA